MKKVENTKISKKQAESLYYECIHTSNDKIDLNTFIQRMEHHGYIEKSDLELAKEEWESIGSRSIDNGTIFEIAENYIEELEKALEKALKK